jgi:hypothetical protein
MKETLSGGAQTAAAKSPFSAKEWWILDKPA